MIEYIKIEGYKSIKKMELELRPINILIGGNGSGKSNFISFFSLLSAIFNNRLQRFIQEEKADRLLYFGRKRTQMIQSKIIFSDNENNNNAYTFALSQTKTGGLFLDYEGSGYNVSKDDDSHNYFYESDLDESTFAKSGRKRHFFLQKYISSLKIFHFHDTSSTSLLRKESDIHDNRRLKNDGRNLPAFLYSLKVKHPIIYNRIKRTIQSVAPYISDFLLEPDTLNEDEIRLRWIDIGDTESEFSAYELSDGTLRFIALTILLLQPAPPEVIIIDEPELGLHPFAVAKLAGMIQVASAKAQVIVGTQSPGLISRFEPEDVIVIDRSKEENQSIFKRLDNKSLEGWLQEYSLGELWERNIFHAAQPFMK